MGNSEIALLRADDTSDGMTHTFGSSDILWFPDVPHDRFELTPRCAMRNHRAWGYIVDISGNSSANKNTPYLLTAVVRIVCVLGSEAEFSRAWVRAPTYTSNFLTSDGGAIQEGSPIFGIVLPAF